MTYSAKLVGQLRTWKEILPLCSPLYERGVRGDFSRRYARKSPLPPFSKGG
jgi:hypothetical protein